MNSLLDSISKTPIFLIIALIANLFIFYFIMQLVTHEGFRPPKLEPINLVDFIRFNESIDAPDEIKPDEELEEPPPPEDIPPPPDLAKPKVKQPDVTEMSLEMPTIESPPLTIDGVPYLGDFAKSPPPTSDSKDAGFGTSSIKPGILTDIRPTLRVQPTYPRRALRSGTEGVVTVEFTITKDGTVKDPVIIKSEPPGVFDSAVLKVINKWKFNPEKYQGKVIEARARQNVRFNLKK